MADFDPAAHYQQMVAAGGRRYTAMEDAQREANRTGQPVTVDGVTLRPMPLRVEAPVELHLPPSAQDDPGDPEPDDPDQPDDDSQAEATVAGIDVRQLEAMSEDPFLAGPPSLGDFVSQMNGSPGFVVDPAIARESTCIGYQLRRDAPPDAEPDLVFAKGVVGALDKDQIEMFCPTVEMRPLTDEQRDRLAAFSDAAETCKVQVADIPHGDRLDPYLSCMSAQLHEHGQRL